MPKLHTLLAQWPFAIQSLSANDLFVLHCNRIIEDIRGPVANRICEMIVRNNKEAFWDRLNCHGFAEYGTGYTHHLAWMKKTRRRGKSANNTTLMNIKPPFGIQLYDKDSRWRPAHSAIVIAHLHEPVILEKRGNGYIHLNTLTASMQDYECEKVRIYPPIENVSRYSWLRLFELLRQLQIPCLSAHKNSAAACR